MSDKVKKIIEAVDSLTVLELNELVKALEEKFGVSASAPVAAGVGSAAAAVAAEPVEEQTSFNVILASTGPNKISVIKALREINPNLGLKEAKDLSEKANAEVLTGANKAAAEEAKTKLIAAGATVALK